MLNLSALRTQRTAKKSKGFTLIELAIVAVFLGVLAVFAIGQFSGAATDSSRASAMYDASTKISSSWAMATTGCGITTDVTANTLGNGATGNLSVLLGTATPATTYAQCFTASGVKAMTGLTQGGPGAEEMFSYNVSMSNGGNLRQLTVTFAGVPDNVVQQAYSKYHSKASTVPTLPATADTTDPLFRFGTPTGGSRSITFVTTL